MTRTNSLHHNLGDKNVVFHRTHRSKKGRKFQPFISEYEINKKNERKIQKFERKENKNENFLAY